MKFTNRRLILLSALPAVMEGHTVMTLGKLSGGGEAPEPPTEFLMWPYGDIATTKGTFKLTKDGAAEILRKVQERGLELSFDYEHATFNPVGNGPVPSAGWHTVEVREDGLWLTNIEWTASAFDMIKARELRYYSPAFEVDDNNEIIDYLNCALTNLPATKNLKPLVASARARGGVSVDRRVTASGGLSFDDIRRELSVLLRDTFSPENYDVWIMELYDEFAVFEHRGDTYKVPYTVNGLSVALTGDAVEVRRVYDEVTEGKTMKTLLITLGLKEGATEAEAVTLARDVMGAHTQLLSLTGTNTAAEALGAVQGWKANSDRLPEVEKQMAETKADTEAKERAALVMTGMNDGKIPPALKDYWEAQPLEAVRNYLSAVMPNPTVKAAPANAEAGAANAGASGVVLTGAAAEVAKAFGNTPAAVAAYTAAKAAAS